MMIIKNTVLITIRVTALVSPSRPGSPINATKTQPKTKIQPETGIYASIEPASCKGSFLGIQFSN